jgi:hypothetical protein
MGSQGVDVRLSEAALRVFPYAVEAKSRASIAVYGYIEQARSNARGRVPLAVIKQNHSEPLVIVSLEHFMKLVKTATYSSEELEANFILRQK